MNYMPASDLAARAPHLTFILKSAGTESFYTGRAGQAFTNADINEAFPYQTLTGARRAAENLNCMTRIHGHHFVAVGLCPYDDFPDPTDEAEYYAELERGYAQDRI